MRILVVSDLHLEFPHSRYEPPCDRYDVVVLAGDIHGSVADLVFIGATLWTDFRLGCPTAGAARCAPMLPCACRRNEAIAGQNINDFRLIADTCTTHGRFDTEAAAKRFALDRAFIENELDSHVGERCIVVTHHLPSTMSISAKFAKSPINCAFASDADDLVARADIWIHGHTHDSQDYRIGGCRVVCNPAGYPRNNGRENPRFNAGLVIETR